ncbi:hypothetical protein JCGZ_04975 [Jatropha curcas]|uniref:ADP-ribosyl cyclase/cyclic ADP-ribose hydrolase n=1 Tax=Jatropha curcas TaxID=180498 RepID=A0A067KV31_JATCU|nr:hypothetical protein JCGZ_04975 [Jatropha curcas]
MSSSFSSSASTSSQRTPSFIINSIAASSPSSTSSQKTPSELNNYEVFINFRGKDIRDGFLSFLFESLKEKGIDTFKDENLQKGTEITPALKQTIQESCISIVIFSKNYADSPWCLDELVVINECREKSGQIVLPVFYHVDPTDVQELRGPFARALARLLKDHSDSSHNLGGWCHALKTISNDLSAFVSNEIKNDQMLVQRIVNRVSEILSHMPSNASYHDKLVGIDSRVEEVKGLSYKEALLLFSLHAFHQNEPKEGYVLLSKEVIRYTQGNPLALKVLGSSLYGKEKEYWESQLLKLKSIPNKRIQDVLKISYDGLDRNEQSIFLDIACFFGKGITGTDKIECISLETMYNERRIEISTKTFMKMPNLRFLRIYGFQCNLPDGLDLFLPEELRFFYWNNYPLKSLPLKFCPNNLVQLLLPESQLKQLWDGDNKPFKSLEVMNLHSSLSLLRISDPFQAPNLEGLCLSSCSRLIEIPSSLKYSTKLVGLHLEDCESIRSLPSFLQLENLEILNLKGCSKLEECPELPCNLRELNLSKTAIKQLPSSIGHCFQLVALSLRGCTNLQNLPDCQLQSLEHNRKKLPKFSTLPNKFRYLKSRKKLDATGSGIKTLPSSFNQLSRLERLNFNRCKGLTVWPFSLSGLNSLQKLYLGNCGISEIPESIGSLVSLKELHLDGNDFESIPASIKQLSNLSTLMLYDCKRLRYLPALPGTRGKDIRDGFLSLFESLKEKEIDTFKDENLQKGTEITPALKQTIQESCISVIIFSKNYADSPWCLDELVVINECREKLGQTVLPVFYRVDPTDVQELRGHFAKALVRLLQDHSDRSHNLGGWCHALKIISNDLSGFVSNEIKDDQMLVQRIVNRLSEILSHMPSNASYHDKLVGIDRSAGK